MRSQLVRIEGCLVPTVGLAVTLECAAKLALFSSCRIGRIYSQPMLSAPEPEGASPGFSQLAAGQLPQEVGLRCLSIGQWQRRHELYSSRTGAGAPRLREQGVAPMG